MIQERNDLRRKWYFEGSQGAYFNEWSLSHFLWGVLIWEITRSHLVSLGLHTLYEIYEGQLFPVQARDTSLENHLGDSLAFVAGTYAASEIKR